MTRASGDGGAALMLGIRELNKSFAGVGGRIAAIRNVSFDVAHGEFFTLLGPSGCGKTTTLQCIAGLEPPDSGVIAMNGRVVFSDRDRIMVPSSHRDLGMVFQSYAIWPHMTVFENVAFPLSVGGRRNSSAEIKRRVMAMLERVELAPLADRPAPYLSGGQQQRVALARALVHEPKLLLLDEPLSNLDARLRDNMRVELRRLVKSLGITTIYVTHDQLEALSMSDRVALLHNGAVVQQGTPRQIFLAPANVFAAEFMGFGNLVPARVTRRPGADRMAQVEVEFGTVTCTAAADHHESEQVVLLLRPHAARLHAGGAAQAENVFAAVVEEISFLGDSVDTLLRLGGRKVRAALDPFASVQVGQTLQIEFPARRCVIVALDTPATGAAPATRPAPALR
jgi:iron(III) transport system ATP-binding protein